ncbi:phage tail fiber protein [Xenorhabdus stockiae]|uniref:Phage tail fiber protein n=1 Tax=Xenorhabdus stockiae TaxID=351614 RepID=A0A2D0KQU5_9GAMM|nr:phage tail protein [Xenorhabdus stockiae]PHM65675.1 phage tail fiber protein [Xenorhabdus stockiae]
MSTKYFALLTKLGADRLANAAALGTKIEITHMAVGDGGGSLPTPDTNQQKLVSEKRRAAINVLSVDPKNTHQIIAEQVIPESEGGWWIREIGLFDKDGVLIAVGNCAETYKPQLQEGSGRTQTIRMVLIVSHTNAVTLKIDPSVVLATREYADTVVAKAISEHEKSRRHPDATLKEKGFVVLNNATDSNSEAQAATPKAVKTAYEWATAVNNNANGRLEKEKNGADIPDKNIFINHLGLRGTVELAANALDKRTGGTVSGSVTVGQLITPSLTIGSGGVYDGNQDAASFEGNNIEIRSWYGVGFKSTHNNPNDVTAIYFNTRNGDIASQGNLSILKNVSTKGKMSADEGVIVGTEAQNALLTPWGDLRGATWGGWLSHWLNDRIAEVNTNVNNRLEKAQNGADIPNKPEFVNHLGLTKTVELAANALDKRTGGTVSGAVTVGQLTTPALTMGSGGVYDGNRDAASFEGNNIEIRSWYGVGFKSTYNNPNDVTSIYFNTRNGDIASQGNLSILKNVSAKGQMTADGGFIAGDESQNALLTPWGDIRGATWGGWLSHWLNASFARKNSGVFSGKGWFKDESTGLIIQWGAESESNRNFNFPHMFSEACFVVLVTNSTSQGARIDNAFGYPVNNSEFYAATKREDGLVNGFPVAWLAIGR